MVFLQYIKASSNKIFQVKTSCFFTWAASVIVKVLQDHGGLVNDTECALHSMLHCNQVTYTDLTCDGVIEEIERERDGGRAAF